jgi:hypothetical protein
MDTILFNTPSSTIIIPYLLLLIAATALIIFNKKLRILEKALLSLMVFIVPVLGIMISLIYMYVFKKTRKIMVE